MTEPDQSATLDGLGVDELVLVSVLAWLDGDPVPVELLSGTDAVPGPGALSGLAAAGLLTKRHDGALTLPEATRHRLLTALDGEGRDLALHLLQAHLGEPGAPGETARCLRLLPHITRWTALTGPEDDTPWGATFLSRAVVLLLNNNMGKAAVPLAERGVRTAERNLGPDASATLTVRANLASVYDQAGDPRRGARLLEKVIAARAAQLGPDHPDVWGLRNNLGAMRLALGEYDEAAGIVEGLIAHWSEVHGPAARRTLMARNNLAVITERAGRREEAVALWEALLPESEAALGTDDPDTVAFRAALFQARADREGTDREAVLAEVDERVALLAGTNGEFTPEAIVALADRARILLEQGRYEEAVGGYRDAIGRGAAALGRGHPVVVSAGYHLAHALELQGDPEAALATARETLADADRSLGRNHHATLMAALSVLSLLLGLERGPEYQEMLEARLADIIEELGFGHPLVRALAAHRASLTLHNPHWR
ncbi:tetratricopeptide repeat protein [Streptomyces sp. NPDC001348]